MYSNEAIMNTVTGNSSKKEHLSKGATTVCNRKMSTGKNDRSFFEWIATNRPETCCTVCLEKYTQSLKNKTV